MKTVRYIYKEGKWNEPFDGSMDSENTLVLVFSSLEEEEVRNEVEKLAQSFPTSVMLGNSTSGEILDECEYDDTIVVAVTKFESTKLKQRTCKKIDTKTSYTDGVDIANELLDEGLRGILVFADGLRTNGSKLTEGMASVLPREVVVGGGLAGDKAKFEKTWIVENGIVKEGIVCAVGFYGRNVHFQAASKGGWDSLGLKRLVTKSHENVLYELDGKPALDIYKRYLGEKSDELPASGLLFPLEIEQEDTDEKVVRTVLAVNEEEKSITFAGDIPQNRYVTFMKANFNRLIGGAEESAQKIRFENYDDQEVLCVAISCVGRKLVLKSRIYEEIEVVKEALPPKTHIIGFYSYGEISPLSTGVCSLHNQTMTLTVIWEDDA